MNASKGIRGSAFGKRMTIEMRPGDGATKQIAVTRGWSEDLLRHERIRDSGSTTVTGNIARNMFVEEEVCA